MTTKYRNYFSGFSFLTGYQYGRYRSREGERSKPLRLVFSGNDSSYGRTLPIVYGRARVADPVLLIAKPEGDFLTTLWAVCEGLLATNAADDTQTSPNLAYSRTQNGDGNYVENIYVNGESRHDSQPNYGIEVANGDQDRAEPAAVFFPTDPSDFITGHLGYWGTARVTFRINTKSNPSIDLSGQSVTGSFEVQYGRVHRVYSDASAYVLRATDDGLMPGANPSFVEMDLLASKRAGAGLDYSRLNIQSFVDLASYCSETVASVFDGSDVKRWTFNGVIDQRRSLQEWLHLVSIGCYSLPPFADKDGLLKVKALKAEDTDSVPLFSSKVASTTGRNIVWENNRSSLVKSRRPITEVPNEIRVNFIDKSFDPGFAATLRGHVVLGIGHNLDATTDPITFTVRWSSDAIAAGAKFIKDDKIIIGNEQMWITNSPDAPDGSGDQIVVCQRAYGGTSKAIHTIGDGVQFKGRSYSRIAIVVSDRETQDSFGANLGDQSRRVLAKSLDLPGTTTADEAARLGTLVLRAGEFAQGGLSNNCKVTFKAFYRDAEDLEIGDIIEVEDDQLDPALNEQYFRVTRISPVPVPLTTGVGIAFTRTIEAVLHDNRIYDDTALNVSKFDRVDSAGASDIEPPAVTDFAITEAGAFDGNNKPVSRLTIDFTEPSPKQNFLSALLYMSNDDGGGDPVGDWRLMGELTTTGGVLELPVTGLVMHFALVSRALSGHHGDIDAKNADGDFVYPRLSVLVDGVQDVLDAPTGVTAFGQQERILIVWNEYDNSTATTKKALLRSYEVWRNTSNTSGTATKISGAGDLRATSFIDVAETIRQNPATTYYYWVKAITLNGTASAFSASAHDNPGTDTGVPDAPVINALQDVANTDGNYTFIYGVDSPGSPANWDTVDTVQVQIAHDSGFSSLVFDHTFALKKPPFTDRFTVAPADAGTYYFRARVFNIFGPSAYSTTLTRATDFSNASGDTDIIPVPATVSIVTAGAGNDLQGDEFEIDFTLPGTQIAGYWGYQYILHDSSTLPDPDYESTATTGHNYSAYAPTGAAASGVINVGSNLLTDSGKSWPTAAGGLTGRRVMIFSPKRPTSGASWADEGFIHLCVIQSNTATVLTLDQNVRLSGTVQYAVLTSSGLTVGEKVKANRVFGDYSPNALTKEDRNRIRRIRVPSALAGSYVWVALANLWGWGKLHGPDTVAITGISIADIVGDGSAPTAPTGLAVTGLLRTILLTWTNSADTDLVSTEIWRASSNNRAGASLISSVPYPAAVYADENISTGATFYYWIRHLDRDGLNSAYQPSGATSGVSATATAPITTTEITNNSISTPKLQANSVTTNELAALSVTAAKISVSTLSAVSADLGTITAGTVTGATLRTGASNPKAQLDSTSGFTAANSIGTIRTQIPISGGNAGDILTSVIKGISTGVVVADSTGAVSVTVLSSGVHIAGGNLNVPDGSGIQNTTGNASTAYPSAQVQHYISGTERARIDATSSGTLLPLWLYKNGTLTQLSYDGSGFVKII